MQVDGEHLARKASFIQALQTHALSQLAVSVIIFSLFSSYIKLFILSVHIFCVLFLVSKGPIPTNQKPHLIPPV